MNIETLHGGDLNRERRLMADMEVAIRNFNNHSGGLSSHDRDIVEKMESNKGEISGRSAMAAEIGLRKYVNFLRTRNSEIERILNSSSEFNRNDLMEELSKNVAEINMYETNCLNTFANINKNL